MVRNWTLIPRDSDFPKCIHLIEIWDPKYSHDFTGLLNVGKNTFEVCFRFFCHHRYCCSSECSQILGQVLMKMWKWDYVRRKNDSPASKDSLKSLFFHCTAKSLLCSSNCFSKSNKKDSGFFWQPQVVFNYLQWEEIRKGHFLLSLFFC